MHEVLTEIVLVIGVAVAAALLLRRVAVPPEVTILARTRYVREVEPLEALGADQVIPEEFETSIELTSRVLRLYGAAEAMVARERATLRNAHYGALRGTELDDDVPSLEALRTAADLELRAGDVLLVYGTGDQLAAVGELVSGS